MKYSSSSGGLVSSLLAVSLLNVGCSEEGDPAPVLPREESGGGYTLAVGPDLPAHGWANVWTDEARVTNGGAAADAAHIYTVTNRAELVRALYPDAAIAEDGTFTSANGPDPTPKIIYVQ